MERDRALFDALSRAKLVVAVVEDFVGVYIRVVVGNDDRFGMVIEHPRAERADHEACALERLVDRRRHVQFARYWLEIVNVECVGVYITIPTNDVERMIRIGVPSLPPPR